MTERLPTASGGESNATRIGAQLRALRAQRGLSLRQLAERIDASASLLSQVENGKVNPSLDTLYQLSNALGVPIASLFDPAPQVTAPPSATAWVVRRAERRRIEFQSGVTWENLLPHEERALRFMEIRYAPGAHSGEHMLRHAGRDMFYVLSGRLTFRVGFSEQTLDPGDSISFGDFEPHHLRNDGEVEARAVVCVVGDLDERPAAGSHGTAQRTNRR